MVALNFKKQFADKVRAMEKRQTIRAYRSTGNPYAGCQLQLYTGMRTKSCEKLSEVKCARTSMILIKENGIEIQGEKITRDEEKALAKKDGFKTAHEFRAFFRNTYGLPFIGQLIEW